MSDENKVVAKAIDYKSVFCTPKGRAVLYDMMKASGYTSSNFDPNPYAMAHNEGLRSMVVRILNFTNMKIEQVEKLIKDEKERESLYGSGSDII